MDAPSLKNENLIPVDTCPICSAASVLAAGEICTINTESRLVVELRECINCTHWWHSPIPQQALLNRLYQTASPFVVSHGWGAPAASRQPLDPFGTLVVGAESHGHSLNYLEVGTGTGVLFHHMQTLGHQCHGIDPGNWCKTPGIVPSMQQLQADVTFDVIVLQDVLEHLASPLDMMSACRSRAKPGTRIYCTFPNRDSWLARHRRERWQMIRPLGHLHYFSKKSLEQLFARSGWVLDDARTSRTRHTMDHLLHRQSLRAYAHLLIGKDQWTARGHRA
jgi:SAM-dependent methyltransferase